jgi:hypothetical protein
LDYASEKEQLKGTRESYYGMFRRIRRGQRATVPTAYAEIAVTEKWTGPEGFTRFIKDLGLRPGPQFSLDRRDNEGDYCPTNCRWATANEQRKNQARIQHAMYDAQPGDTFGFLTARAAPIRGGYKGGGPRIVCRCACGDEKIYRLKDLVLGVTQSCGCGGKEKIAS